MKTTLFLRNNENRILESLFKDNISLTYRSQLGHPGYISKPMQFILPPHWTTEVPRRLSVMFPHLAQRQPGLYIQSFIHPTFTLKGGERSTMKLLEPLGDAILEQVIAQWILYTFESIRSDECYTLTRFLSSDLSLSHVVREKWQLDDLILADNAAADLFGKNRNSMRQWMESRIPNNSSAIIPESYVASCLKSFVGAVLLNANYLETKAFCCEHVLPFLG